MSEQADLRELFVVFHDFLIKKVIAQDDTLILDIEIPWTELVSDANNIRVELLNCRKGECDYAIAVDTPSNLSRLPAQREYVKQSTKDPQLISDLLLEVQHFDHSPPDEYVLHCNSSNPRCAGGDLTLTASSFKVYDSLGNEVGIETIRKWGKEWWQQIGASGTE